jgi:hypothetical protein
MVDLLIYVHPGREMEKRFHAMITAEGTRANTEVINAFGVLRERLKRPSDNRKMALLFVDSKEELSQILSLQDLLTPVPFILILNDHDPKIISLAHLLRPRFIGYTDWDIQMLLSVVTRMIRHWESREA